MSEDTLSIPQTGPELRELRKVAGLSTLEVALRLGLYENKVSRWERGLDRIPEGMDAQYRRAVLEISAEKAKAARERCKRRKGQVPA